MSYGDKQIWLPLRASPILVMVIVIIYLLLIRWEVVAQSSEQQFCYNSYDSLWLCSLKEYIMQ